MALVCTGCYESYSNTIREMAFHDFGEDSFYVCPKRSCGGEIIEIDDNLALTIINLNQKGYYTKSSCAGHADDANPLTYIVFDEEVETLPYPPPGFLMARVTGEESSNLIIARATEDIFDLANIFQELQENALILYKWSLQIPCRHPYCMIGNCNDDCEVRNFHVNGEENKKEQEPAKIDPEKLAEKIKNSTISIEDFKKISEQSGIEPEPETEEEKDEEDPREKE